MRTRHKVLLISGVVLSGLSLGYCTTYRTVTPVDPEPAEVQRQLPPPAPIVDQEEETSGDQEDIVPEDLPQYVLEEGWSEPYHPFLEDEASGASVSVGTTTTGYLVNARVLPLPGLTYDILPRQRLRDLAYGSDQMIDLIQDAAQVLHKRHGRRLWMGNIGRRGGGDISYSVSHNSGRDADIAFCYVDPDGNPVDPPDLVHLDNNGASINFDGFYRFDTARTWTVIKALLRHKGTQIQYLFISDPLKKKLMRYAKKRGESRKLVDRADMILKQPGSAAPHNDHIHVRIYCSQKDVESGCINFGQTVPGTKMYLDSRSRRIREVVRFFGHNDPIQRERAIERLVLLGASERVDRIVRLLNDEVPRVRRAAAVAVGRMGQGGDVNPLVKAFGNEADAWVQVALLDALRLLGGARSARFLGDVIADSRYDLLEAGMLPHAIRVAYTEPAPEPEGYRPKEKSTWKEPGLQVAVGVPRYTGQTLPLAERFYTVRLAAIEAAAESERTEPVPALVSVLGDHDPLLRGRAARALRRLSNHSFGVAWDNPDLSGAEQDKGLEAWQKWLDLYEDKPRKVWLAAGFKARNYRVPRLNNKSIWEIVRAIPDDDFVSYNAQRALMRLSEHQPESVMWSKGDAAWHWTRWFERHRREFRLPNCPPSLSMFNR